MTDQKSELTHFVFDGKTISTSSNLITTMLFLSEIEKEIQELLFYNQNLESIRDSFLLVFDELKSVYEFLIANKLERKSLITNDIISIANKFKLIPMPRSQMICLFAYMETIFCLITVFKYKLEGDKEIISQSNRDLERCINKYILVDQNDFFKRNKEKFKGISAKDILDLRNSLTHFYSVGEKILVIPDLLKSDADKVEEYLLKLGHRFVFISPSDFNNILKGVFLLLFEEWTLLSLNNPCKFSENFAFVERIVSRKSAILAPLKSNI